MSVGTAVTRAAVAALDEQRVAKRDIFQEPEMRVAMRGDHRIAGIARLRRSVEVSRPERERASRGARQHEDVGLVRRDEEACDRMGVGPRPRLDGAAGVALPVPRPVQQHLRESRLRVNVDAMPEARDSGRK